MLCLAMGAVVPACHGVFLLHLQSEEQLGSSRAFCQQSLLRRDFSGSSSFGLPFYLIPFQGRGVQRGNTLGKVSLLVIQSFS